MTFRSRMSLTWRYGKYLFLVGAAYNVLCAASQAQAFSYAFLVDAFLMKPAVTDHNYDAITSVADDLFVIADGYTHLIRCREDLVRYGYFH